MWSSPATIGERPPPCAFFTLTSVSNKRAVMFGGYNEFYGRMKNLYLLDLECMVIDCIIIIYNYIVDEFIIQNCSQQN